MFVFTLQSVLDCRKASEDNKLLEFSNKTKELVREKDMLERLRKERSLLVEQLRRTTGKVSDADSLSLQIMSIKQMIELEKKQKELISRVARELESKKEELLEAIKQRKMMETLRERQFGEFRDNMESLERKQADETSIARFVRREV